MKIESLQALRAIAAMMVVAFHANVFILPERLFEGDTSWLGFNMGYAGVEIFFVLSGFIMAYVHRHEFGVAARAPNFLIRRVIRIYPFYWVVLFGMVFLYNLMPGRGPDTASDPLAIVTSALLVPTEEPPILRVAWTLQYEMLFYFVFLGMFLSKRFGFGIFTLWMAGCVWNFFVHSNSLALEFLFSSYNFLFLFGIVACMAKHHLARDPARLVFVIGTVSFLFVGLSEAYGVVSWDPDLRALSYGAASALIIAGLAQASFGRCRWLEFLGDASYSIYLTHMPAMTILAAALAAANVANPLSPTATMFALLLFTAVAGSIAHVVVERPMLRWLAQRTRSTPGGVLTGAKGENA